MMPFKEWLKTEDVVKMREKNTIGRNMTYEFFRDPVRPVEYNPEIFLAFADGVILYARDNVKPDDFLEIKGKDFTLPTMLCDDKYSEESVVVGIFMTSYDVHINRVPVNVLYLEDRKTNFIFTHCISMLIVEHDLMNLFDFHKKDLEYMVANERKVSVFYAPLIKGIFYLVQIGDKDINVIQNWGVDKFHMQGDRFGAIRWGSQVDLVIPKRKEYKYEILVKKMDHVEAGIDPILRVTK
jgi:phosphatidylserine decarboxylase